MNSSETIHNTIESVLKQTYQEIEYIIIDGKSSDNTLEIIEEYKKYFKHRLKCLSEKDSGIYDAMNKGIALATGDIIGILNSDDLFVTDDVIRKVSQAFIENQDIDCLHADLYYVSKENTNNIVRYWKSGQLREFSKGWHPAHPTFFVRREVYEKFGLFDLNFKLAADFELMLRFIEKNQVKLYYLEEPIVKMRLGGATNKSIKNIFLGNIECYNAFKKNGIKVNLSYPFYRLLPKLKQFIHK